LALKHSAISEKGTFLQKPFLYFPAARLHAGANPHDLLAQ